jgi:membrane-bound serine protease (ClpP class)
MWHSDAVLILLFTSGVLLLVLEFFIPSGGFLTVGAVIVLVCAIVLTWQRDPRAGLAAAVTSGIAVPALLLFILKHVTRLPMGRRLAPPNPESSSGRTTEQVEALRNLVGRRGRAVTPLRPVGICEFDGRRVSCVAEMGMMEKDTSVEGCGVSGSDLIVRAVSDGQ